MRRNKHNNTKVTYNGITFDSKKEWFRYMDLLMLETAGKISDIEVHPRFDLKVNGELVCRFYPDFKYKIGDKTVVEDVKGMKAGAAWAHFRLKAKLLHALTGITVEVI